MLIDPTHAMAAIARGVDATLGEAPDRFDLLLGHLSQVDDTAPPPQELVDRLDVLATAAPSDDAEALVNYVFGELGFVGNASNYYEPSNSLLHRVLRRRRGLPLSLAIVAAEISRRAGGDLQVIGFPGHVLLGEPKQSARWFDPFAAGAILDADDLRELLRESRPGMDLDNELVAPMTGVDVVARVLNNLDNAYRRFGMFDRAANVAYLRLSLAEVSVDDRRGAVNLLGALGRYDVAIAILDELLDLDEPNKSTYLDLGDRLRAHRN